MSEYLWILPVALLAFFWWRNRGASTADLQALRARGAQILDVRTPAEFAGGHAAGALNIPLEQLGQRLDKLDKARPVICCCASGARSGMAASLLKAQGFEAVNGGPWGRMEALA